MSSFSLALILLLCALLAQSLAAGLATERYLRKAQPPLARRCWLALAIGSLIFALQHGYALELAVSTGLHDLRQALSGKRVQPAQALLHLLEAERHAACLVDGDGILILLQSRDARAHGLGLV